MHKGSLHANGGQTVGTEIDVKISIKDQIVVFFQNATKETIVNSIIYKKLALLDLIAIQTYVRLTM